MGGSQSQSYDLNEESEKAAQEKHDIVPSNEILDETKVTKFVSSEENYHQRSSSHTKQGSSSHTPPGSSSQGTEVHELSRQHPPEDVPLENRPTFETTETMQMKEAVTAE